MRSFSDEERERIREQLIETGRERLVTFGPSKTTITDITDPAGIAKPTFYQFFDAKSALYVEIFERELDDLAATLESELTGVEDPRERLERFFRCYAAFGEGNEFVQQVFLRGDYRDVIGDLSGDQIDELERKELAVFVPPIEAIQARSDGPIAEMEPLTVLGILGSSLGWMILHRDDYETYTDALQEFEEIEGFEGGVYDTLRDKLIETLARGLTIAD